MVSIGNVAFSRVLSFSNYCVSSHGDHGEPAFAPAPPPRAPARAAAGSGGDARAPAAGQATLANKQDGKGCFTAPLGFDQKVRRGVGKLDVESPEGGCLALRACQGSRREMRGLGGLGSLKRGGRVSPQGSRHEDGGGTQTRNAVFETEVPIRTKKRSWTPMTGNQAPSQTPSCKGGGGSRALSLSLVTGDPGKQKDSKDTPAGEHAGSWTSICVNALCRAGPGPGPWAASGSATSKTRNSAEVPPLHVPLSPPL